LNEIYSAIKRNEKDPEDENDDKRVSCILPRSTNEFEKSKTIHKVTAIRGLSSKTDIPINLPHGSESILVSKLHCDARFPAIAS
jgi:hypothetical protein